jgi:NADH-quinone oxidoreductase subunit G
VPPPLKPQVWAPRWNSNQALNKFQEEVGGPLRDEMVGPSLVRPTGSRLQQSEAVIPEGFQPRSGEWFALPRFEIFGSDELSAAAPALSTRIPPASVALHPDDAAPVGWTAGNTLIVELGRTELRLPLMTDPSVPRGTAGISHLGTCVSLPLSGWCRITKDESP